MVSTSPLVFSAVIPTQYAQNVVQSLQSLAVVGDATQHDPTGILERPGNFLKQFREKGESQLQALSRLDGMINGDLTADRLPRARQNLVGPAFFKPGETELKVSRYVSMVRQYALALPHLVQASDIIEGSYSDPRAPIAACVHIGETLIKEGLPLPAFDLYEAGILEAYRSASEAGSELTKLLGPIRIMLYILHSISQSGFEKESASTLLLSMTAALQTFPSLGREVVSSGLIATISGLSIVHPALISESQLKEARNFSSILGIPPAILSERELREFAELAASAIDSLASRA